MTQKFSAADGNVVDVGKLFADWRQYAAVQRVGDYDDIFGDELSVPIIYEPL